MALEYPSSAFNNGGTDYTVPTTAKKVLIKNLDVSGALDIPEHLFTNVVLTPVDPTQTFQAGDTPTLEGVIQNPLVPVTKTAETVAGVTKYYLNFGLYAQGYVMRGTTKIPLAALYEVKVELQLTATQYGDMPDVTGTRVFIKGDHAISMATVGTLLQPVISFSILALSFPMDTVADINVIVAV